MNRKGQALVEFVLILPIFILFLFAVVDFGFLLSEKNELENASLDVAMMVKNNKSVEEIVAFYPNYDIQIEKENDFVKVLILKDFKFMTPGFNIILGDPYKIKVERNVVKNET